MEPASFRQRKLSQPDRVPPRGKPHWEQAGGGTKQERSVRLVSCRKEAADKAVAPTGGGTCNGSHVQGKGGGGGDGEGETEWRSHHIFPDDGSTKLRPP